MDREEQLRQIVGHLLQLAPENVTAATVLSGRLSGSIGRARLDAVLRSELGLSRPEVYTVVTYGQLAEVICERESNASKTGEVRPKVDNAAAIGSVDAAHHNGVGIDIESIRNLPAAADYWESPFYKSHFTSQEIGYCILRPDPTESFAGLWSAKEALKKTSPKWAQLDWQAVEVAHTPGGSPYLLAQGTDLRPEYTVSISHAAEFSIAVVVRTPFAEPEKKTVITPPAGTSSIKSRSLATPINLALFLLSVILFCSTWYIIRIHR